MIVIVLACILAVVQAVEFSQELASLLEQVGFTGYWALVGWALSLNLLAALNLLLVALWLRAIQPKHSKGAGDLE